MADNDGSIILGTELDTSGISKGLGGLGTIAAKGLKIAGVAVAAVGAGLVTAGKYAVSVGSDFDSAMSQVAATMGTTVDQVQSLSDAALEMGSTTQFTATEAAEALNYLALAGYDAEKQAAALPTVLNLAAAGNMDLAYASDLVTDSMAALGLETSELSDYSDKLAKTAQTSNTSVAQLGEAVLVCGGQAKLAGMDVTDMNTALGILADNGIKGSEGGTALRNTLKNLYTPTSQAKKAMDELGVTTVNADGSLRDTQDVLQDLSGALDGLGEADRMAAMDKIFDTRTIAAANALLKGSGDRWDELSGKIDNASGATAEMAETMLDNLEGDVTLFKSALEGLGVTAYDSLRDPLRESVQWATGLVQQMQEAANEGGLSGLVEVMGDILAQVVSKITEFAPKITEASAGLIMNFVTGIQESLPEIVSAVGEVGTIFVESMAEIIPALIETGIQLVLMLAQTVGEQLPTLIPIVVQGIVDVAAAIVENIPLFVDAALSLITGLVDGLIAAAPILVEAIPDLIGGVADAIVECVPQIVDAAVSLATAIAEALPDIIIGIVEALPGALSEIINAILTCLPQLIQGCIQLVLGLVGALPEIITSLIEALPTIIQMVVTALVTALPLLIEGAIQLVFGIVQALPEIIVALIEAVPYIVESLVSALLGLAVTLVQCGVSFVASMIEGINNTWSSLLSNVSGLVSRLLTSITTWFRGMIERGRGFVTNLWSGITGAWSRITTGLATSCRNLITSVTSFFSGFVSVGRNIVTGLWNGISAGWSWLVSKVSGLAKSLLKSAKSALGISSPSKAFRDQVGKMMAKGVGVGWEKEIPTVYRNIQASINGEQATLSEKASDSSTAKAAAFGEMIQIGALNISTKELKQQSDYERVMREAGAQYSRAARQRGAFNPA